MAKTDPFAALRYVQFRHLIGGVMLFSLATQIQEVVVAYQLYQMTHDPLVLGIVGLAEALPFIALALYGGHIADHFDRTRIMLMSVSFIIAGSLFLLWTLSAAAAARLPQSRIVLMIYGVIAAFGLARGFLTPAASSLIAFLVPRELYPNSSAWRSAGWQGSAIVGPALGGLLYALVGLTWTLILVILLMAAAWALFARIRARSQAESPAVRESLWQSLGAGVDFVFKTRILLYSISLDLFSVLFGGVVAILPVYASDILHVGPEGLGLLRAAPALGAMLTLLAVIRFPPTRHSWRNLLIAVAGFGVATLVFAVSTSFALTLAALFMTGAFDSVSVVIRTTILQVMPPDHLRGRVQSVNSIFITTSNELGAFESGVAAKLFGAVPSVLAGGAITLLVVAYVWRRSKALFDVQLV